MVIVDVVACEYDVKGSNGGGRGCARSCVGRRSVLTLEIRLVVMVVVAGVSRSCDDGCAVVPGGGDYVGGVMIVMLEIMLVIVVVVRVGVSGVVMVVDGLGGVVGGVVVVCGGGREDDYSC